MMQQWSFVQCSRSEDNFMDNLHHHNLHPEESRKMRAKDLESSRHPVHRTRKRHHPDLEDISLIGEPLRKSRASSRFSSNRDSSSGEDNLSDLLASRNQRLDSLSYDKIKNYKPFDHARNRHNRATIGKTTEKSEGNSGIIIMDARTFRTVMTMTGGLMRRYIVGPLVRALSNQMALDESSSPGAAPSANFAATLQSKKRP